MLYRIRQDDDHRADFHALLEVEDVLVAQADAAFRRAGPDAFGEGGAVDADVPEARHVQAQEPGAVGILDGAFAILEVVREAFGVEELVDLEGPFRGLVVAADLLGAEVDGAGDAVFFDGLALGVSERELEALFVDHDEGRLC